MEFPTEIIRNFTGWVFLFRSPCLVHGIDAVQTPSRRTRLRELSAFDGVRHAHVVEHTGSWWMRQAMRMMEMGFVTLYHRTI